MVLSLKHHLHIAFGRFRGKKKNWDLKGIQGDGMSLWNALALNFGGSIGRMRWWCVVMGILVVKKGMAAVTLMRVLERIMTVRQRQGQY